jgi:hypothetical protein
VLPSAAVVGGPDAHIHLVVYFSDLESTMSPDAIMMVNDQKQ